MNDPNDFLNDPELLTVAEYARRFGISENTVRTRINRKKLNTTKVVEDGREIIKILVDHSMNSYTDHSEQSETIHEQSMSSPMNSPEQSSELLEFFKDTLSTVQAYTTQVIELSRENERYKLLTENSSRTIHVVEQENEQLKKELFEREAKIKELEARLNNPKTIQEKKGTWWPW